MSDREPKEDALDQAMRAAFREAAADRGPCPPAADLVKYHSAELGPEASATVRDHLFACGYCEMYVDRLEQFDDAVKTETVRGEIRHAMEGRGTGSWAWRFGALIACGLVLLMAYPAWQGLFPEKATPPPPRPVVSPLRTFELAQTRPANGASSAIELRQGEERFAVSFFAPLKPGSPSAAVFRDSAGKIVAETRDLTSTSLGTVTLLCETAVFRSGRYTVTVTEAGPEARVFDYMFEVVAPRRE